MSTSRPERDGEAARVGLCVSCRHVERVTSKRKMMFYRCRRSFTDPLFPKYPTLPVRSCIGYEPPQADPRYRPVPLIFERLTPVEQTARLNAFCERMKTRRTVRHFSREPIPDALIDGAIAVAGSAPSGANMQPWRFVVVRDHETKQKIRAAAEEEERALYEKRAPDDWLARLAPLGTDWRKEFLETAPCLIVVFRVDYEIERDDGGAERHVKHYYVAESVGIACGFLLAALQIAGLATLTHTPSPMGFLSSILERPRNEKPFLLIPVGFPAPGAEVPAITKKPLDAIRINL